MENSQFVGQSRLSIDESLQFDPASEGDGDYLCPVCNCIICDPIGCGVCKQHLCQECLREWRDKGKETCPISGCTIFKEEKAHPFFYKYLSNIQLKCPNFNNGCEKIIIHEQFKQHVDNCEFSNWACDNEGCEFKSLQKDIEQHQNECNFILLQCIWCKGHFPQKIFNEHQENICQERLFECKNDQCNSKLKRKEYQNHQIGCEFKPMSCGQCNILIPNKFYQEHVKDLCNQRPVNCQWCQSQFLAQNLKSHLDNCDQILIQCSICQNQFQQNIFQNHDRIECLTISFVDLKKHVQQLTGENLALQAEVQSSVETIRSLEDEVIQSQEIMVQETILVAEQTNIERSIHEMLKRDIIPHCEKSHGAQLQTYEQALNHYMYLHGTYILYQGWHKLHCSHCMTATGQAQNFIDKNLARKNEIDREIIFMTLQK